MAGLEDMVAEHPPARIAGVGLVGTLVPFAATWVADGWLDGALVGIGLLVGTVTAAAAAARKRLDALPLALASQAAWSRVDGRDEVRFRACLGKGRACRPTMRVRFEPETGAPRELPVTLAVEHVCGPFVGSVERPGEPGTYVVEVAAGSEKAETRYPPTALVEGHFGHGIAVGRKVRFDGDWGRISPPGSAGAPD